MSARGQRQRCRGAARSWDCCAAEEADEHLGWAELQPPLLLQRARSPPPVAGDVLRGQVTEAALGLLHSGASRRDVVLAGLSLAVLLLGTLLCALARRYRRLDVVAVAVAGAGVAAWLLTDQPVEGATLVVLLPGNGVTVADLAALPAALLAAVLCWRRLHGR